MNNENLSDSLLLEATGIVKNYGGVRALKGVDFTVNLGEVHALVGANGAGKSTLIKMISGAEKPDKGSIKVRGEELQLGSSQASMNLGISTVYQEPHLFGELTVAENIYIGRELKKLGTVDWDRQRNQVINLLRDLNLDESIVDTRVADLPVGIQQLVSIAKAFARNPKVLILDEPSAILADDDIERLFDAVRKMRNLGVGVIYISHRLDELEKITDRITIMRDGLVIETKNTKEISRAEIAQKMIGHEVSNILVNRNTSPGKVVLDLQNISSGKTLRNVSLKVHKGEVVCVYGLIGSGTTDLALAVAGLQTINDGKMMLNGESVIWRSASDAGKKGVYLLPGNRKRFGVFLDKSLAFNISASHLKFFSKLGLVLDKQKELKVTNEYMDILKVKAPNAQTRIGALSGGNQQKIVLARQLVEDPKLIVLEEPSQGVDVGAKEEIHKLIHSQADNDKAVLVISTDLEEVRQLADKIIVLHKGTVGQTFKRGVPMYMLLGAASGVSYSDSEYLIS